MIWQVTWHDFYVDSFILSDVVVLEKIPLLAFLSLPRKRNLFDMLFDGKFDSLHNIIC